jgi:hypothetical protein
MSTYFSIFLSFEIQSFEVWKKKLGYTWRFSYHGLFTLSYLKITLNKFMNLNFQLKLMYIKKGFVYAIKMWKLMKHLFISVKLFYQNCYYTFRKHVILKRTNVSWFREWSLKVKHKNIPGTKCLAVFCLELNSWPLKADFLRI